MSEQRSRASGDSPESGERKELPAWACATLQDVQGFDFEAPIVSSATADCSELSDHFVASLKAAGAEPGQPSGPMTRVYTMLAGVTGMYLRVAQKNDPFGPLFIFSDGKRSAIPDDFCGATLEVLAYMAERSQNPTLRARLSDVCWLLDRKRAGLGGLAVSSYCDIVDGV